MMIQNSSSAEYVVTLFQSRISIVPSPKSRTKSNAEFGAQAANDEAQAAYEAREGSYADAQAGRW